MKKLGFPRAINRTKWQEKELLRRIASRRIPARAFRTLTRVLRNRRRCSAFHPEAAQRVPDFGPEIFAVERVSPDGRQAVLCLSNLTGQRRPVHLDRSREHSFRGGPWRCLISERRRGSNDRVLLAPYETVWLLRGPLSPPTGSSGG